MHGLERVYRVNYPPDVWWVFDIDRQIGPFLASGFDDDGVFCVQFFLARIQLDLGGFNRFSFINRLQISHEFLLVFADHIFQGIADLVE